MNAAKYYSGEPGHRYFVQLGNFAFECDDVIEGVPVNPRLPADFDNTPNQERPDQHMAWWDVPFVRVYHDTSPAFVNYWQGEYRYDLRCLDGGAWDRSTCLGQFAMMQFAIDAAKKRRAAL